MNSTTVEMKKASPRLRARPNPALGSTMIGPEEETLVLDVLRRKELFRYYGMDPAKPPPMAAQLEKEFREFIGVEHALAVSSCTGGLEVALAAAGIGPGDEVIVTAWSWISCFSSIVRVGARPVLAEIDETFNLDPAEIGRLATAQTRAVMVIHYQGVAAEMERIQEEAHRRGLLVIEDCAQSMGVRYHDRRVGAWGDIAAFSFQYAKVATSGEGGMVVTRDPRLYERAVRLHDLGNFRPYHAAIMPPREPALVGGQFRMSELAAAVALAQLRKVDRLREHCHELQARILPRLAGLKGLSLRRIPDPVGDFGYEIYLLLKEPAHVALFKQYLSARNVNCGQRTGTSPQYTRDYVLTGLAHTPAASPFSKFKDWPAPGYRAQDFPRTEYITKRSLALPIGWLYTKKDADYVAESVIAAHREICA